MYPNPSFATSFTHWNTLKIVTPGSICAGFETRVLIGGKFAGSFGVLHARDSAILATRPAALRIVNSKRYCRPGFNPRIGSSCFRFNCSLKRRVCCCLPLTMSTVAATGSAVSNCTTPARGTRRLGLAIHFGGRLTAGALWRHAAATTPNAALRFGVPSHVPCCCCSPDQRHRV